MKTKKPQLTHTEIYAYAIHYVNEQYLKDEDNISRAEQQGNTELADLVRSNSQWRGKLITLCQLYELETGVPHEFMPE